MPLATPTLTISDPLANPSAVTYTVAGSNVAAVNTLRFAKFSGPAGPVTWSTFATFTGNASAVTATVAAGWYFWQVSSTLAGETTVSNIVYQPILNVTRTAILTRCINSIVSILQALNLTGVGSNVLAVTNVNELSHAIGSCVVFRDPMAPPVELGYSSSFDNMEYPIQVAFTAVDTVGQNSPQPKYDSWMQDAQRCFRNQRLDDVPESVVCRVTPTMLPAENVPQFYDTVRAVFTIRCEVRERRGFGL